MSTQQHNFWDELVSEKKAESLATDMVWGCNCGPIKQSTGRANIVGWEVVQVDGEGICLLCGHYAVRMSKAHLDGLKRCSRDNKIIR